jgi:CRISPR-associated endoribonuclease Cas6
MLINRKTSKSGLCFESAFFILSSPDDRFIKSFAEGLLQEPGFYLDGPRGKVDFAIERIEILEDRSLPN